MKIHKLFLGILIIFLIVFLCVYLKNINNKEDGTLDVYQIEYNDIVIKEKIIERTGKVFYYTELNLIDVLEKIGVNFKHKKNKIIIYSNENKFILYLPDSNNEPISLKNYKTNNSFIFPPPGSVVFVYKKYNEFVMFDNETISHILREIGLPSEFNIDIKKSKLLISNEEGGQGTVSVKPKQQ